VVPFVASWLFDTVTYRKSEGEESMGRQRRSGPDLVKLSVLIPPELNRQVEAVAASRRYSKSDAFRHLLELGIDAEQRQEDPPISLPGSGDQGPTVTIAVSAELWGLVGFAARVNGQQPAALVQQLLSEHVAACVAKVREELEEFHRLRRGEQGPPPDDRE
jgi:hypothetical protein